MINAGEMTHEHGEVWKSLLAVKADISCQSTLQATLGKILRHEAVSTSEERVVSVVDAFHALFSGTQEAADADLEKRAEGISVRIVELEGVKTELESRLDVLERELLTTLQRTHASGGTRCFHRDGEIANGEFVEMMEELGLKHRFRTKTAAAEKHAWHEFTVVYWSKPTLYLEAHSVGPCSEFGMITTPGNRHKNAEHDYSGTCSGGMDGWKKFGASRQRTCFDIKGCSKALVKLMVMRIMKLSDGEQ